VRMRSRPASRFLVHVTFEACPAGGPRRRFISTLRTTSQPMDREPSYVAIRIARVCPRGPTYPRVSPRRDADSVTPLEACATGGSKGDP
jgi:hypothetical protein